MPGGVDFRESGSSVNIVCPNCGSIIVHGVVHRGDVGPVPRAAERIEELREMTIPDDFDSGVVEIWWTDLEFVAAIHGRPICGSQNLYTYVKKLRERSAGETA